MLFLWIKRRNFIREMRCTTKGQRLKMHRSNSISSIFKEESPLKLAIGSSQKYVGEM